MNICIAVLNEPRPCIVSKFVKVYSQSDVRGSALCMHVLNLTARLETAMWGSTDHHRPMVLHQRVKSAKKHVNVLHRFIFKSPGKINPSRTHSLSASDLIGVSSLNLGLCIALMNSTNGKWKNWINWDFDNSVLSQVLAFKSYLISTDC